jgi:hypothetical protein
VLVSVRSCAVTGRHREVLAPGFEPDEPVADTSPDPSIDNSPPRSRCVALVVGTVLVAAVLLGITGFAMFGGTSDSSLRSVPPVPRPTVMVAPERPTPTVYPTRGVYVPPIPTAAPTTRMPTPTLKPTKPTASTTTTSPQRPPCPNQLPIFHDWCIRKGYQPPRG